MLKLLLYVAGEDDDTRALHRALADSLAGALAPGDWHLEVVDVLNAPERAQVHDVFATPTLVRELPEPVLKLIGDLTQARQLIGGLLGPAQPGQTIVV